MADNASAKVYVPGRIHPDIQVPMREIRLTTSPHKGHHEKANRTFHIYDTSGPYTDPNFKIDFKN